MKDEPTDITELRRRVAKANELSEFNHQIGFDNRGNHVLGAFLTGVLQEYDTLRAERDEWKNRAEKAERRVFEERTNRAFAVRAVEAERDALRKVTAFFRSVILSGEKWSDYCQEMYDAALTVPL
jgi:hypothetical protein